MRVVDGSYRQHDLGHGIGHYHRLAAEPTARLTSFDRPAAPRFELDYSAILARWESATTPTMRAEYAASLGVSVESLDRLEAVYAADRGVWAFPMHDARRQVIGVRFRAADARKFALSGSQSGAFIPRGLDSRSSLLICEGPTDTAAVMSLGFAAIGRPSNTGAVGIISDMLAAGRRRDVVIVADADGPGRYGASSLADRIVGLCKFVRIISTEPHKDVRDWVKAGARPIDICQRIEAAFFHGVR